MSYTPPVPHARPALLQTLLTLPPNSTVRLTMDVVKPFLRYTEHPPDAQRGWDLPPAVFVPLANATGARPRRVYTPVLLVDLATPDFSMPYNVIIFTSTAIALAFGGLYNILVRRFVGRDEGPEVTLVRLRRKIQERVQALKGRVQGKTGAPAKGARAPGKQD